MATFKQSISSAKKNILSYNVMRYFGFVTAFIGALILLLGTNVSEKIIQIVALAIILVGFLLFSGNVKKLFKNQGTKKDVTIYLLIGLLLITAGILLFVFGGEISQWLNLIFGILISLYALAMVIYFAVTFKGRKKTLSIIDLIIASLLIVTGILMAILFKVHDHTYVLVAGTFAATSGGLAMIFY